MNNQPRANPRIGFTLLELLVVIAVIGILFGLAMVAVQRSRQAAINKSCQNNLRQIGLALMMHHNSKEVFPSGWRTSNRTGIAFTGWMMNILPFVGESALYQKIQETPFKWPFDYEYFAISTVVKRYLCPEDMKSQTPATVPNYIGWTFDVAYTDYLGVAGKNRGAKDGILYLGSQVKMTDIVDGASHTLLVGERPPSSDKWFGQWFTAFGHGDGIHDALSGVREYSLGGSTRLLLDCPVNTPTNYQAPKTWEETCSFLHFWSYHSGGANFLFADGSVRLMPYAASGVMEALSTRAGGEVVADY